jgi:hypothetical protein
MQNILKFVIDNQEKLEKINQLKHKTIPTASNEIENHNYKKMVEQNRIIPLYQLSIDFINTALMQDIIK